MGARTGAGLWWAQPPLLHPLPGLLLNTHQELRKLATEPQVEPAGKLDTQIRFSKWRGKQELGPTLLQRCMSTITLQSTFQCDSPGPRVPLTELDGNMQHCGRRKGADASDVILRQIEGRRKWNWLNSALAASLATCAGHHVRW